MFTQYAKDLERVRINQFKVEVGEEYFLKEIAGKADKGIPVVPLRIGGFDQVWLLGTDLVQYHAIVQDKDSPSHGPFPYVATKDGTVFFPQDKSWNDVTRLLMLSVGELTLNEDITKRSDVLDNQVIAVGALVFGMSDDDRRGSVVMVDGYYIHPTFD